jgi:hypothetical protein
MFHTAPIVPEMAVAPNDELPHGVGFVDEWLFAAWTDDASLGLVSGHRLLAERAWYWSALARAGRPLLHLAEWSVVRRSDPFVVKAPEMWAEHHCVSPWEQWSIGNEAFFVALDDPSEALGKAYGTPTPTSMDLEWYAIGVVVEIPNGVSQDGVVHGRIDIAGEQALDLTEVPARRWRRWSTGQLAPVPLETVIAHAGIRAPFSFPDGTVADWTLSPQGWRARDLRRPPA